MSFRDILEQQLRNDEGVRYKPYRDSVGKLTIGVGRNLDDVGLRDSEISVLLSNDMAVAETLARTLLPNFDALSDLRKAVVCNMAFNLGMRLAGFKETLGAIREGRWEDAANNMLDSVWAQQVGLRARRLADDMRQG